MGRGCRIALQDSVSTQSAPGISPDVHIGDHIVDGMFRKSDLIESFGESSDSLESGLKRTHNQMATEQPPKGAGTHAKRDAGA
jgi:hypothetical protein